MSTEFRKGGLVGAGWGRPRRPLLNHSHSSLYRLRIWQSSPTEDDPFF